MMCWHEIENAKIRARFSNSGSKDEYKYFRLLISRMKTNWNKIIGTRFRISIKNDLYT